MSLQEAYREIYDRLKSQGPPYIEQLDNESAPKRELLERIKTLPHPDVASRWDIREVCEELSAGQLEWIYQLAGDDARDLLRRLREESEEKRIQRDDRGSIGTELQLMNEQIALQRSMLRGLTGGQSTIQQLLDITLKSNCPDCGEDLEITVLRQSSQADKLQISCRNPKCSGNQPSWNVANIV